MLRRNSLANPKFSRTLAEVIEEAKASDGASKGQGNLLYTVAGKVRDG